MREDHLGDYVGKQQVPCTSNWMDKFAVLTNPILLAIAEAKMLEAAEKHNVTDIMVPRGHGEV